MDALSLVKLLLPANLLILGMLFLYLLSKLNRHPSVPLFLAALVPVAIFEFGSHLFVRSPDSWNGAFLIVLGVALVPLGLTPLSHTLGRGAERRLSFAWLGYYSVQLLVLALCLRELISGQLVEWVTGILDQPIILIEKNSKWFFANLLLFSAVALLGFDSTLRKASGSYLDTLKSIFIALLGLIVYFFYLAVHILVSSYITQSMLLSGTVMIFLGLLLLTYSFAKYPFWEVHILVSRRVVFGSLTATAILTYLAISGTLLDLLRLIQPDGYEILFPAAVFALVAAFLVLYLSPNFRKTALSFIARNFFRNKYDYRDLWMKFSEKSSGSLYLNELLPRVAEFIADAMFVRQVAVWLRSPTSDGFSLAYHHDPVSFAPGENFALRLNRQLHSNELNAIYEVPDGNAAASFPINNLAALERLGVKRLVLVEKNNNVLALLGIGAASGKQHPSIEDDRLLASFSNQLGHLILTHKLSEDLLLAREWDSFNRFSSFILHDLKNLATLQSMTLENAKHLSNNPAFVSDAFATFNQTTDKMINLIASLSVQRGQFSLKQQPVNILEVVASTVDQLKIEQRNGLKFITTFPPKENPPIISGDPELLQKAFTNLLLNAIQSLPKGEGHVEVTVSHPHDGKITAAIKDTGCGIPPEQLKNLFRPFQTTKKNGMGIGLSHTRSIIEVHGGHIRIDSQLNAGTKVELEFPTHSRS